MKRRDDMSKCGNCRFFTETKRRPVRDSDIVFVDGECRKRAPVRYGDIERVLPSGADPCAAVWPIVSDYDGCGDFEALT